MKLFIVLLLLQALLVKTCYAQQTAPPRDFRDEVSKQAEIYNSAGRKVPEGYVIGRSLLSYTVILPPEFRHSLAGLSAQDRWLDIGAGEGHAVLDYRTSKYDVMLPGAGEGRAKAQAIAMSIEDRRTSRWHEAAASLGDKELKYMFGRRLREYSNEELGGQFQLITDVLGGFSYTRLVSVFMEKTLGLLAVNGSFYTVLQDVQSEHGKNRPFYPPSPFLTELVRRDGSEMKVCAWLKRIRCVEVSCEFKPDSSPPLESYHVRKTCAGVVVPELVPVHFEAGTPPERRFQTKGTIREASEPADARN